MPQGDESTEGRGHSTEFWLGHPEVEVVVKVIDWRRCLESGAENPVAMYHQVQRIMGRVRHEE